MRALTACVLCLPLLAVAQPGTTITDPGAAPQGRVNQPTGDTQANAQAAYREAQARCRTVTPPRQRQECVAEAMREAAGQPRTRRPSVETRAASAPPAASAASQ
ncbi:MAG: hypothetical protein AB1430_19570 [Pseudomonadota bacterium]